MAAVACIFCQIAEGSAPALVIDEDEHVISFLPLHPKVDGHTLLIPKAHHADIYTTPAEVLHRLITTAQRHASRWRDRLGATGINVLHASGVDAEQSVFHVHFHLFPRFKDDGLHTWPPLPVVAQPREDMQARFRLDR
ncbi:MAG: HIT family protein [Kofleriaceae bacterium]